MRRTLENQIEALEIAIEKATTEGEKKVLRGELNLTIGLLKSMDGNMEVWGF